jgi:hypothetical protein
VGQTKGFEVTRVASRGEGRHFSTNHSRRRSVVIGISLRYHCGEMKVHTIRFVTFQSKFKLRFN